MAQTRRQGDRLPRTVWHAADQSLAARAASSKPHDIGGGRGLVEEDRRGRVKKALSSDPAPARPGRVGARLLRCAQAFFKADLVARKKRQTAVRLPAIRRLPIAATTSSSVKLGCSAIRASNQLACSSNGEMLPSVSFAATLALARQRWSPLIAELGLISNRSAASRRDAPPSTASTTRSRKSIE
jgi:hypothetical protein